MSIVLRLTHEVPTDELGVSCIYCGHVCQKGTDKLSFSEAARAGYELCLHALCAEILTGNQIVSAAVVRVGEQLKRGYYGTQFVEDAWNAMGRPQLLRKP